MHLEFLVEEPSMEAFLRASVPRHLKANNTFEIHAFQGKEDMLAKLPARLRGYSRWLPADWRIIVALDRDNQDCRALKAEIEDFALKARLRTRTTSGGTSWQVANRIVVEELEAWYFGEWEAVRAAYPRAPVDVPRSSPYRYPDGIQGGTWEAFERIMQRAGYFQGGMTKIEAAKLIGAEVDAARSNSPSMRCFFSAIAEAALFDDTSSEE